MIEKRVRTMHLVLSGLGFLLVVLATPTARAVDMSGQINVSRNTMLRDGRPWVAKGVVIVGLVAPTEHLFSPYAEANKNFGEDELNAIARYGADLIRFQVSQGGADPASDIYSPDYVAEVVKGVHAARVKGFSVIVSLQSQGPSGERQKSAMPSDSTFRAWRNLAPLFSSDKGVMLEIFNEPSAVPRSETPGPALTWEDWRVAMQSAIDEIRHTGNHNALIVDGFQLARTFRGAPVLYDPYSNIVYAVHPYPRPGYEEAADWDAAFGIFSQSHPILVTEWNARPAQHCDLDMSKIASDFLTYAKAHNIGIVGWAFDFPGTLFNVDGTLTDYGDRRCSKNSSSGAGEILHNYFLKRIR